MAKEMDRRAREARQRFIAQHDKTAALAKMHAHQEKLQANALVRAHAAGVPQAELARILKVSPGRVWQLLRDAGAFAVDDEPEPAEAEAG